MSRNKRAASFLFEPTRFRTDPAVMAMSPAARGAYIILLCAGWDLPKPGVFPADDRLLAQLAMCTSGEWASVRQEVSAAFTVTDRAWTQKGLLRTKAAQDRFVSRQSERGRAGANATNAKWLSGASAATALDAGSPQPTSVLGSRFSGSETLALPDSVLESNGSALSGVGVRSRFGDPGIFAELAARHPRVDLDLIAAKVLDDGPCRNLRNKLRNWTRIADERGMDLKPLLERLTFGNEESP